MVNSVTVALLNQFASGPTVEDRWTAARQLMAAKQLTSVLSRPEFDIGFNAIGGEAKSSDGLPRLLAVDLIVRLSSFVKKLQPKAETLLKEGLQRELPSISLVADKKNLPAGAKPANIREHIAIALREVSGDWILPYIVRALAEEDRSRRCRLELARQLAVRDRSIDSWFAKLGEQPALRNLTRDFGIDKAVARLRDLSAVLADVMRQESVRLTASEVAGQELARLCQWIVRLPARSSIPTRLGDAAVGVARLLDELLAVRLTLIVEPDTYAILETFQQWWQPLPYPRPLKTALLPITDKLVSGVTMRARFGQRSEGLATRLRQAIGEPKEADKRFAQIANTETGLAPEIDDWLRGTKRVASSTAEALTGALRSVASQDATVALAPLFLDAMEAAESLEGDSSEGLAEHLRRLCTRIKSIASQRGLEVAGRSGEIVEFSPSAHQTASGNTPAEPKVKIVRPMVIHRREDGRVDIIVKAVVTE